MNAYLGGANFRQASFSGASLVGSWLGGTDLSEANLQKADFRGAHMEGVRSGGIVTTTALLPIGYKMINGFIVGPGVDLSIPAIGNWAEKRMVDSLAEAPSGYGDAGTTCAELRDRVVRGSKPPHIDDLQGKSLAGLDLTGANLSGLNLSGVDFRGTNLTRVNFSGAELSGAKFDGATVVDVFEDLQTLLDDAVRLQTLDVRHEAHTAGVLLSGHLRRGGAVAVGPDGTRRQRHNPATT